MTRFESEKQFEKYNSRIGQICRETNERVNDFIRFGKSFLSVTLRLRFVIE